MELFCRWFLPRPVGLELPTHPGILILDQAPPETLARVLAGFLGATAPEQLRNALLRWHRLGGWQQPIVGGKWEPYQPPADASQE